MATKISSDISTNVDITSRKLDSFFLTAQVDNIDGTRFDLTSYSTMELIITNSNNTIVEYDVKSKIR